MSDTLQVSIWICKMKMEAYSCLENHDNVKASSRQGQRKFMARSRKGLGKVIARSRQGREASSTTVIALMSIR